MNTHDKADRLHELGHEVAAAALRRSTMWDPADIREFTPIRVTRGQEVRPRSRELHNTLYTPRAFQPGRVWLHKEDEFGHNIFNALRVGKHIGPVTHQELESLFGHPYARVGMPRRTYGLDHPIASGGHGLHHSDPSHRSFEFLKQHLDNPAIWPIIADHFEENGGTRAGAMAELLRQKVVPGPLDRHGNLMSPVTWPIPVRWGAKNERFGVQIGNHTIQPLEEDDTKPSRMRRGLTAPHYYRNLDSIMERLK